MASDVPNRFSVASSPVDQKQMDEVMGIIIVPTLLGVDELRSLKKESTASVVITGTLKQSLPYEQLEHSL